MRRALCLLFIYCTLLPLSAQSRRGRVQLFQQPERNRFAWEYDADFQYIFDNREFDASGGAFLPSETMHTVVFAPTVGFSVEQSRTVLHRLSAGLELAHDMGTRNWADLPRELLLYYDAHVQTRGGSFEGVAGIFPRRFLQGSYSEAIFSDSYRLSDRNVEGLLLKWHAPAFQTELGLDWLGKYGPGSRERFQIFSAGAWQATRWLSLGWAGSFYHFACAPGAENVIDNHLLNPWIKLDASRHTAWQELSAQVGALVTYQWDRGYDTKPRTPFGGELVLSVRRWNVGLRNTSYMGRNLQPYYKAKAPEGGTYGSALYFGTPLYNGFYDCLVLDWTPRLTYYLSLRIAARFHFNNNGFVGWQQQLTLRFSLDALRHRENPAGLITSSFAGSSSSFAGLTGESPIL